MTEGTGSLIRDALDRPLRDLRISVIDRCNFRCTYCMPAEIYGESYAFLRREELLTLEEIGRIARLFAALGVRKVKITGGEPLLREWLPELIRDLAGIPEIEDLALITNGTRLAGMAQRLKEAGLHRVSLSLDSLSPQTFARINGRGYRVERVLRAIEAALRAGLAPVKINMVVMRGVNDHEVVDFVRRFRGTSCIVRFIEFMDAGTHNRWDRSQVVPSRELLERIAAVFPLEALEASYRGEVARRYRLLDGGGEVGFISSVSQPFCRDCSRVRLAADGTLYTCLFAARGTDLRGPLRAGASDRELLELMRGIWRGRSDRYSEERQRMRGKAGSTKKVEMYHIGG